MSKPAVLVADDEPILRRLLRRVLEAGGWRVLMASDGDEAAEVLACDPDGVAVVVLDLRMPPGGGLPLVERIHGLRPGAGLVVTSGLPPEPEVERWLARAGAVFLQKPFAPERLCEEVTRLAQREGACPA